MVTDEWRPPPDSWSSSEGNRRSMVANRSRDTRPELAVRRLLYARGLRYRVAYRPVPALRRTADVVFTRQRLAVFIDGCFWHGCPLHRTRPTRNAEFWGEKLDRNAARDADTTSRLEAAGWTVLRFWEHEAAEAVVEAIVATIVFGPKTPDAGP